MKGKKGKPNKGRRPKRNGVKGGLGAEKNPSHGLRTESQKVPETTGRGDAAFGWSVASFSLSLH